MGRNKDIEDQGSQNKNKKKKLLYMNRKYVENGFSVISVMILASVFFLVALFLVIFPRSETSDIEKRELADFPVFSLESYFDGTFTEGVTEYYDDTVPYRDTFKNIANNIINLFGFTAGEDEVKIIGNLEKVSSSDDESDSDTSDSDTSDSDTSEETSTEEENSATSAESEDTDDSSDDTSGESQKDYTQEEAEYTVENGIIVVKQDDHYRAMELFGGGTGSAYVSALQLIKEELGDDVAVYSMPIPLASEYYLPSNYSDYSADQTEYFEELAENLGDSIISVDAASVLALHTEEAIYFRTDHHWAPLGAYYAAQAFAEVAGVPFADLSTYEEIVNEEEFVGTMYSYTKDANLLNDPEEFIYYEPSNTYQTYYYLTDFTYDGTGNLLWKATGSNSYLVFMGGDEKVVKVVTDVDNGRKLCIVKDSYGNAEVPFFTSSFEEIYVIDMRYFDCNLVDFVQEMGITDLLFTMCSYSVYGTNADNLENLRTQCKGEAIVDAAPVKKEDE